MNPTPSEVAEGDEVHASFVAMDAIANRRAPTTNAEQVSWTGPEYEQHSKNAKWYLVLFLAFIVSSGVIYLFTRDILSPIFVLGIAGMAWYYARHKPEDKVFSFDPSGLSMGKNYYPIEQFKSFAVDTITSPTPNIVLYPLRRLMPPITLNCPVDKLQEILAVISQVLPVEDHVPTRFDLMISRIKF